MTKPVQGPNGRLTFETRGVLAGAYVRRRPDSLLTHVVELVNDEETRVLCGRVEVDSLSDPYSGDTAATASCPTCRRRDPREHKQTFRTLSESATDEWESYLAPGDSRYVPAVVRPEMPDVVARAVAAGMPAGVEYIGAGMTGVVFCTADDVAYKVARRMTPIAHHTFEDEAEWLEAAQRSKIASSVAAFHWFDPNNLVIERDCPRAGPDLTPYRYGEGKLFDLHRAIEQAMIPHGWTAPEFKPDSYVITARGPVLVDASMPSRVGHELARYIEDVASSRRRLWVDKPSDLAFYARNERGRTLTDEEVVRLEALIARRWPGSQASA